VALLLSAGRLLIGQTRGRRRRPNFPDLASRKSERWLFGLLYVFAESCLVPMRTRMQHVVSTENSRSHGLGGALPTAAPITTPILIAANGQRSARLSLD